MISLTSLVDLIESAFGRGRLSKNNNFDVRCPVCNPSDPQKKKLSILLPSCACHCWVCGWKARSIAPLLRKYGTQKHLEVYRELSGSNNTVDFSIIEKSQKIELPHNFQLLTLANIADPDVRAAWKYIHARGLTDKDAWYFKFGISNELRWKRRVIMPSFDSSGELNYFIARAIDKITKPKYDNPDVDKNPIVFNEINLNWNKRLVLCEGPFDLVKCPENSTALLGSDLDERHEVFNKIVLHNTPIALALDGDMWHKKMPKVVKKLQEYDIDVVVVDTRPWGDPGNMTKFEFDKALTEARAVEWNEIFFNRLKKVTKINFRL